MFDPQTNTFAVGKPNNTTMGGSPHQNLARSIGADPNEVVGGIFHHSPNGAIVTNEQGGHYWQNWTDEIREQSVSVMKSYGLEVIHED